MTDRDASQGRLDALFAGHIATALFAGLSALFFPRLWLWFLHEELPMNEAGYEVRRRIERPLPVKWADTACGLWL